MIPRHIFLDTNVFAGQQYNFESSAFNAFVSAATSQSIELLLPDPIEREVLRHIRERSAEALRALHEARRAAPFLKKWSHFPNASIAQGVDYEITRVANNEWHRFKQQFTVKQLGYEGVQIAKVMRWYDGAVAPFGKGQKRKEFPDAFAVAILDKFAESNAGTIAVVSDDADMKMACKSRPRFLSFTSLSRLTELLVLGTSETETLRDALLGDVDLLQDAVLDEAMSNLTFYHEHPDMEITESSALSVEFSDVRVAGLSQDEATLTFEAVISAEHELQWSEMDYDDEFVTRRKSVVDFGEVNGVAKVSLDPKSRAIAEVTRVDLDETELPVSEAPFHR